MPPEVREFRRGDDAAYEDWMRQHGGYVLVERSGGDFMLHQSACGHLELSPRFTLTTRPRRWAKTRQPLVDRAKQQSGHDPELCQSCM
jgi:hypothetical protein